MSTSTTEKEKFDPSRRRLCPDGACIGLLDENGRCRECGQQGGGAGAAPVIVPDPPEEDEEAEEQLDAATEEGRGGGFDAGRRLCPDGACLGVIGADGRCSVCGRTEEG